MTQDSAPTGKLNPGSAARPDGANGDAQLREVLARTTAAALAVSSAGSGRVFEDLALGLADVLEVDAVLIAEFVDDARAKMRTLALSFEGRLLKRFEYDVSQTPCRLIVGHESRFVPSGVHSEFAPGTLFSAQGFDSYAGYSLISDAGIQLGIIVALDRKPIANRELTEALLKIFAVRATAELERVRAEAALAASESSYRAIFESAEEAIFVHDWETGAIVDVNQAACRAYGWNREEMLRLSVADFSSNVPPYTLANALQHVEAAKRGETVRFEWHRRNKDGSLHWDEVVLHGAHIGGVRRVLAFTREISDRKRAEDALRASEEQYRAIFNASADALILWDSQYRRVDVNPAYERIYGWSREEVVGRSYQHPMFSPEYEQPRRELVRRALAGEACRAELEAIRGDGTRIRTEVHAIPFRHRGEPHVLAIARDITERKSAEEALRASEEQYRAIFNASADALVLRDADFRIVDVNATYERMSGWSRDEVLGVDRVIANPPDVARVIRAKHARALAGETIGLEVPFVRRDGARYELELRAVPILHRGQPHVLYMGRDVTERVRAENALRASEEQYRAIFNASADALVLWDSRYKRVDVNPAYQKMYGWKREEMIGKGYEDSLFPPEYAKARLDLVRRALGGEDCQAELEAICSDGTRLQTEVHAIPFQHRGEPHVLAIARDITERKRAEEALRTSEEQYRAIFEAGTDSLQLIDAEHRVVDVNPAYERMYGKRREDVIGKTLNDLVPEAFRAERRTLVQQALAGRAAEIQTTGFRSDGTAFDLEVRVIPFQHRGQPHVLGIARDITERKRAEEALRLREEQYRVIFDGATDAIALWDRKVRIVDVNKAFTELYGYAREEVIDGSLGHRISEEGRAKRVELIRRALAGEEGIIETEGVKKNGDRFDVELRYLPIVHRGEPHVLAIGRDISARRQAEAALRSSEEQYRSIFNASADSMLLRDDNMTIVDANPAFLALCGLTRGQVIGRAHAPFVADKYEDATDELLKDALAGKRGLLEAQMPAHDGALLDVEIRAMPMLYRGRPHVLAIARNITADKRAEAERARLEARLRQAQKMEAIGQLTGGIAHDFNNILASVMGYVVLAEERASEQGDARTVDYLGQSLASCRRARDLIQQMLTFSRGGRGEPRALSLAALVRDAMPMMRSVLPSTLAIDVEVDDKAPAVWLDDVQAHQVLLNLAINARDAMPTGGRLSIRVSRRELSDASCSSCRHPVEGPYVELRVADEGTGIDADAIERIFDPFYTTKELGKGSGMGLSMVHGIVHEHHGHVLVESKRGVGTNFSVLLPPHAATVEDARPKTAKRSARPRVTGRVLLVDDEPSVLTVLRETLISWGIDVVPCSSAEEAEEIFRDEPDRFDLLLTDHAMPLVTGIELAERLRAMRPGLRWLLSSGCIDAATEQRAREAGVTALLPKPIERDDLRRTVTAALAGDARD